MKSQEHLAEARLFLEELAAKPPALPYEPQLLPMLFAATRDGSNASVDDLTELIERSQKLAVRVLAVANSAVYALESTVTSLRRAVSVLGFREVRTIVVMLGAVSVIRGAKLAKGFDANALWLHQLKTAAAAKAMTSVLCRGGFDAVQKRLEMGPDEAYVAGLLHDIGKVFLASGRPEVWAQIEQMRRAEGTSFAEAETAYWGIDHALIGAQVLHYWKLPLLLTDAINWHHAPHVAPAYKLEAGLLAAANAVAHEGFDENGTFPEAALAVLPADLDAAAFGAAVAEEFKAASTEVLAGLVE